MYLFVKLACNFERLLVRFHRSPLACTTPQYAQGTRISSCLVKLSWLIYCRWNLIPTITVQVAWKQTRWFLKMQILTPQWFPQHSFWHTLSPMLRHRQAWKPTSRLWTMLLAGHLSQLWGVFQAIFTFLLCIANAFIFSN